MQHLNNLEPKRVMEYFEEICAIPHGSGNTKEISDYCADFARAHGFEYYQDDMNNIIIICPASEGYENSPAVIIQGHLDMVCEKEDGYDFDFKKDGLNLRINGDFIDAEGTTLGGDDGIAVAMALALMDSDLPHPKIEAVFTVDEEVGMLGAAKIDLSVLTGKTLINIDSEDEGVLTVGCAGGSCTKCVIPVMYEKRTGNVYKITVDGLFGGHSGVEINKGRANADMLIGRLLFELANFCNISISELSGGLKDNAIPVSSSAVIVCDCDFSETIEKYRKIFEKEYKSADGGIKISVKPLGKYERSVLVKNCAKRIVSFLISVPNGVINMSRDIDGLVQTSLNLGILTLTDNALEASFSVRSSLGSEKELLNTRLGAITDSFGGYIEISGDYPAWEYNDNSKLRNLMVEVFKEQYGREPKIEAIHAGLECGIFCGKIDGLDCVSLGPDILEIHTPRDRLSISSTARVWKFINEVFKRVCQQHIVDRRKK